MEIIFYNQQFLKASEVCLSLNDRGLLLGDGVFETMRIYAGKVLFLEKHLARLKQALMVLEIALPITEQKLQAHIEKLIQLNQVRAEASVRLTITRGAAERGILPPAQPNPTLLITLAELTPNQETITAIIASFPKNAASPLVKMKSINYLENILGRMEAQKKAADEVLFLNQHQHLTSASCANVFIVKNAILYTPLLTDGILPGITRQILLTIAAGKQIKAIEKSITLSELLQADEVFITNSLIIIKPIVKINTQLIAHGKKGHLTSLLQKYFVEYINNLHS